MSKILLHSISQLYQVSDCQEIYKAGENMQDACLRKNAYVLIENEQITEIGNMSDLGERQKENLSESIDCTGKIVFPGFVDSHTHLVFPKTREEEYLFKIQGMTYEEIAQKGGGILNSARALTHISEEELLLASLERCQNVLKTGTTTLEIKSGYGLSLQGELKLLRVANALKKHTSQTIKTTFLGAHAIPLEYKNQREKYIDLVCEEMIPQISEEKLADFIDVFCETGFFTQAETEKILLKGAEYDLPAKIHVNQLDFSGGVQLGTRMGAISVDHLERITEEDIFSLQERQKNSPYDCTVPTLLPSCSFFLRDPYSPARKLIAAGLPVCLATDYNPGSSPSGNMAFVMSLACTYMRLLPTEALAAMTLNGAYALRLSEKVGSIEVGKQADIIITKPLQHLARIPYSFGENLIERVICKGV